MTVATAIEQRVEWAGSPLTAPGPGIKQEGAKLRIGNAVRGLDMNYYRLLGTVLYVIESDPNNIKVRWDNERVTVERRTNLRFI